MYLDSTNDTDSWQVTWLFGLNKESIIAGKTYSAKDLDALGFAPWLGKAPQSSHYKAVICGEENEPPTKETTQTAPQNPHGELETLGE